MTFTMPLYDDGDPPEPVPDRWLDFSGPTKQYRSCSVQAGWRPLVTIEAWLDTGYPGSVFDYTFGLSIGPWRFAFDWRPVIGQTPESLRGAATALEGAMG